MKRFVFAFALVLSFLLATVPNAQVPQSAAPAQAVNDETARLNAWFETKFEERLAFSPIQQTFLGRKSGPIAGKSIAPQQKHLARARA